MKREPINQEFYKRKRVPKDKILKESSNPNSIRSYQKNPNRGDKKDSKNDSWGIDEFRGIK